MFPFGFGLSYTTFSYSDYIAPKSMATDTPAAVTLNVKNTGKLAGDEIVEMYVRDLKPPLDRPIRELKGFQRVFAEARRAEAGDNRDPRRGRLRTGTSRTHAWRNPIPVTTR